MGFSLSEVICSRKWWVGGVSAGRGGEGRGSSQNDLDALQPLRRTDGRAVGGGLGEATADASLRLSNFSQKKNKLLSPPSLRRVKFSLFNFHFLIFGSPVCGGVEPPASGRRTD